MDQNHKCLITRTDSRDFIKGVNSPIPFKALIPSGDWTSYMFFRELQKIGNFETEGCVCFTAQESFDAQMEYMIQNGFVSAELLALFDTLGYMDSVNSDDSKPHFHSSARFVQIQTGNGFNGNALQDPWLALRTYGALPWTDLPFDVTITQTEYLTGVTQAMLNKAQQFLAAIGGHDSIQFHWIVQGGQENDIPAMIQALPQAPLCLGTPAIAPDWNEVEPPVPASDSPNHSTMNYLIDSLRSLVEILDHYVPYLKELVFAYPIPQAMQGVLAVVPPPPPPVLPPNPTVSQEISWLDRLETWLQNIFNSISGIKGRNQNQTMNSFLGFARYIGALIVFAILNAALTALVGTGWFTTAGAAILTGAVGWIEHKVTAPPPTF